MRFASLLATMTSLGFALASATASAQSITYDYDKSADFSKVKTYAWASGVNQLDDFNDRRVVAAIDSQLTAKGFRKVETNADADVLVAYHTRFERDVQLAGYSSGWARFGNRTGSARTEDVVNGMLVVDVVDAKSEGLLWRGIARKEVDPKASPEKRDHEVNKVVEKLLKKFPPTK